MACQTGSGNDLPSGHNGGRPRTTSRPELPSRRHLAPLVYPLPPQLPRPAFRNRRADHHFARLRPGGCRRSHPLGLWRAWPWRRTSRVSCRSRSGETGGPRSRPGWQARARAGPRCSRHTRTGTSPAIRRLVSSIGTNSSPTALTRASASRICTLRPIPAGHACAGIPMVAWIRQTIEERPLVSAWLTCSKGAWATRSCLQAERLQCRRVVESTASWPSAAAARSSAAGKPWRSQVDRPCSQAHLPSSCASRSCLACKVTFRGFSTRLGIRGATRRRMWTSTAPFIGAHAG